MLGMTEGRNSDEGKALLECSHSRSLASSGYGGGEEDSEIARPRVHMDSTRWAVSQCCAVSAVSTEPSAPALRGELTRALWRGLFINWNAHDS